MLNPTFDNQNKMRVPYTKGNINYELSKLPMAIGMGNVLAVLSDRRIAYTKFRVVEYYSPDIVSSSDYYPFGMAMPGRQFSSNAYRYGFNGMEKDDEVAGEGNSYTAMFWQYDSRLGRRWNVDFVYKHSRSNYSTFSNNPIIFIDPNGDDDYYYDGKTITFFSTVGVPNMYYVLGHVVGLKNGGYIQTYRVATANEIAHMANSSSTFFNHALKNAGSLEERNELFLMVYQKNQCDNWKVMGYTLAIPLVVIAAAEAPVAFATNFLFNAGSQFIFSDYQVSEIDWFDASVSGATSLIPGGKVYFKYFKFNMLAVATDAAASSLVNITISGGFESVGGKISGGDFFIDFGIGMISGSLGELIGSGAGVSSKLINDWLDSQIENISSSTARALLKGAKPYLKEALERAVSTAKDKAVDELSE